MKRMFSTCLTACERSPNSLNHHKQQCDLQHNGGTEGEGEREKEMEGEGRKKEREEGRERGERVRREDTQQNDT